MGFNDEVFSDVLVVSAYPPDRGRLSEYAKMLFTSFARRNKSIRLIVLADHQSTLNVGRINVVGCWKPDRPYTFPRILSEIFRRKPNVVVFNVSFAVFGKSRLTNFIGFMIIFLTNIFKKIFKYRTVIILHNLPEFTNIEAFKLKYSLPNRIGFLVAEKIAMLNDLVLTTLKLYSRAISKRFKRKVFYLPHGTWEANSDRNHVRDSITFIGFISPTKDLKSLIEAYKIVKKKYKWLKLHIIGSNHPNYPEMASLLKELKREDDDIHVHGYVSDHEIFQILSKTIAVILPYRTATGSSGVLHLASSAGVPVIGTDLPELRELMNDGAGVLLTELNAEKIANNIISLIENKHVWNMLSKRMLEFSAKRRWPIVAEELYRIFKEHHIIS